MVSIRFENSSSSMSAVSGASHLAHPRRYGCSCLRQSLFHPTRCWIEAGTGLTQKGHATFLPGPKTYLRLYRIAGRWIKDCIYSFLEVVAFILDDA